MSNRPNRARRPGPGAGQPAPDRRRTLLIAGGVVVLVVIIGILLALGGAEDDAAIDDDRPDFGPVAVDGPPLPELGDGTDAALGTPAPVVEGTDPEGSGVTIGEPGGPTLVAFLAHWCPHCQNEVPVLVDLAAEGELDGVRLVAVLTGTDEGAPNYPPVAWLEREEWSGEIILDDERGTAARAYGLSGFPFVVALDAEGNVAGRVSGESGRAGLLQLVDAARAG